MIRKRFQALTSPGTLSITLMSINNGRTMFIYEPGYYYFIILLLIASPFCYLIDMSVLIALIIIGVVIAILSINLHAMNLGMNKINEITVSNTLPIQSLASDYINRRKVIVRIVLPIELLLIATSLIYFTSLYILFLIVVFVDYLFDHSMIRRLLSMIQMELGKKDLIINISNECKE